MASPQLLSCSNVIILIRSYQPTESKHKPLFYLLQTIKVPSIVPFGIILVMPLPVAAVMGKSSLTMPKKAFHSCL